MDPEIRHIEVSDLSSIIDDLSDMQDIRPERREMALRMLRWWFFENPAGNGIYAGAFIESRLAGVASLTPKRFLIDGQVVVGAEIGRTMTHADFRGRGIFSLLVNHLVEQARSRDIQIIFGTPNEQSGRIYLGRLEWASLFNPDRVGRPVRWEGLGARAGQAGKAIASIAGRAHNLVFSPRLEGCSYAVSSEIDPELAEFLKTACAASSCVLERSEAYLRWRYARPDRNYVHLCLRTSANELVGWAVTSQADNLGQRRLQVGDYWVAPGTKTLERALWSALIEHSREEGVDQIYGIARSGEGRRSTAGLGFVRRSTPMPVIGFSPLGFDLERLSSWEYRDSDADMY